MISRLHQTARFWLRLLLVLQVAGLFGHAHAASGAASKAHAEKRQSAALTQILGYDVAICHHRDGDNQEPNQGSSGDCCTGGFCHCFSPVLDAPSSSGIVAPRIAAPAAASPLLRFVAPVLAPQIGANNARGPPVSV